MERGRYAPEELIFASMCGTPLQPSNFRQRVWDPALRRAALDREGYRFHDLRRTCVSRLVAAGADVKLVRAVAGHANPVITLKRYSHLHDARVTEAAERFDPARAT
ncbi:MAG: tyrosine-type recombinase/integrase [Thermoleophilia bacterium]|nr:tyrosine-type recombinase/integrase [Thermoleophilia bacterium]